MKRWLFYTQSFALGVMLIATVAIGIFPDKIRESFRNAINADMAKEFEKPIKLAEKTLEIPGIGILISPDKLKIAREEIIFYRVDPIEYIESLTGNVDSSKDRLQEAIKGANPSQRAILEKIIGWREKITIHFSIAFDMVLIYLIVFFGYKHSFAPVCHLLDTLGAVENTSSRFNIFNINLDRRLF